MGKCETSKGIFMVHQCGNDTSIVCKRCGKYVCNEHCSESAAGTYCAACLYDDACCQTGGDSGAESVIRRFFGEIGNTGKYDNSTGTAKTIDTGKLADAQSREKYLVSLRKSVDSPMITADNVIAAAVVMPLAVQELFAFENTVSELPDPAGGSKGAGFTDS